jgi:hypothetical protein
VYTPGRYGGTFFSQTYVTNQNVTIPGSAYDIKIILVGGGGGGGPGQIGGSFYMGGGGGGSGYVTRYNLSIPEQPNMTLSITNIGAAGNGRSYGSGSGIPYAGGTTKVTVIYSTTVYAYLNAPGGNPAVDPNYFPPTALGGSGGDGDAGGGGGDSSALQSGPGGNGMNGANGSAGTNGGVGGYGGAGAFGYTYDITTPPASTNQGGWGGGRLAGQGTNGPTGGNATGNFGGGGGGAGANNASVGGNGAPGCVIVSYWT